MTDAIRAVTPSGEETELTGETMATLATAIRALGADDSLREKVVALCRAAERQFGLRHGDVRETITGPIVDALHAPGMMLRKEIAGGLVFDFRYRSKIARDLVLSPEPRPDHVWEPQTTRLLVYFASTARHVVIGGGYIGDHAVLVARAMLRHGGLCHAFEPNPEAADLMRRNAENNGVADLNVSELGLWNVNDRRLVFLGNDSHARTVCAGAVESRSIATVTIDSYCAEQGINRVDVIMLDIEGGELAALEGAIGLLRRPGKEAPVVVFEIHRSYVNWSNGLDKTPPVRLLLEAGYTVFAIRDFQSNVPMKNCLIELLPLDALYLEGPPHGFNMLAVKETALVQTDAFRLCQNKSPKLLLYKDPTLHHPTEWLGHPPAWLVGRGEAP
jgi:FkbM family methyltransferase